MPTFISDGAAIYYEVVGDGQPIVLVHGFASSFKRNWRNTSWVEFLTGHGYQLIGLDVRGHGSSEKFYDPQMYGPARMARDVINLLDHLKIRQADLMGYSMGGGIALYLAMYHADRFRKIILGGIGDGVIREGYVAARPTQIAAALETDDPASITDPVARQFRNFAEQTQNDLRALAAIMRRPRAAGDLMRVTKINRPVLIVVGEKDMIVSGASKVAQVIPGAQFVTIPDRDHLNVVGDQRYKEVVLKFLSET